MKLKIIGLLICSLILISMFSGITTAKNVTSNAHDDLEILKKLGKLRKAEVITEKEFQAKKKKILDRI